MAQHPILVIVGVQIIGNTVKVGILRIIRIAIAIGVGILELAEDAILIIVGIQVVGNTI